MMLFNPPWETKIGQLQQVTRTIQRNSDSVLDNRGAVIVRCYPYRSATYMHLVYNLIYSTLASNTQFGTDQTPDEIRPILLNYSSDGNSSKAKQSYSNPSVIMTTPQSGAASFAGGVFHFADGQQPPQQHQWTDCVLIRVHFRSHECALFFMQLFNRSVFRVFDRRQVRAPFCHADLTRPERVLRNYLQQLCDEKNSIANRQQQQYYRGRFSNVSARYYHNGFHLYKELSNGRVELVPWEQYSLGQYLHVMVASLRKYAALYKQKQCFVIIQNVAEHTGSVEEDSERVTSIVYSIVSTDSYRQRCIQIKQKLELLKNTATAANSATSVNAQPNLQAGGHLPQRIERLPRRGFGSSASRSTATVTTTRGEEQRVGKGQQQQTFRQMQQQQKTTTPMAAEKQRGDEAHIAGGGQKANEESNALSSRPALVRVHFRTREAAIAFCQLFRERQIFLRQKRQQQQSYQQQKQEDDAFVKQQTDAAHDPDGEEHEDEAEEEQQTDSYSDLSDLDVFSSCEEDDNGVANETLPATTKTEEKKTTTVMAHHQKQEQQKESGGGQQMTETKDGADEAQQKTEVKKEEDKNNNNISAMKRKKMQSPLQRHHHHVSNEERRQQRHQHLLDSLIIDAFAHRDLTPPELALGYALRQHCREQNNVPNSHVFLYPRAGRIFERTAATVGAK